MTEKRYVLQTCSGTYEIAYSASNKELTLPGAGLVGSIQAFSVKATPARGKDGDREQND